jgi:hypothetical protein
MPCNEDGECPFCTKKTDSLSANPSEWAVTLPIEGNGKTNKCHVGCVMTKITEAKDKPLALTPQPISTAPKDGTPILVWCEDDDWNAWVTAKWIDGSWYGDHDCSWKANNLDVRTPQWWLPMPPEPTKMLNGIVVNRGKAIPPKYEMEEE